MKKKMITIITCIMLTIMTVIPVSASELPALGSAKTDNTVFITRSSNYFSKSLSKMNALNYGYSNIVHVTSGSVTGTTRSITNVTVYIRLSGSSCVLHVMSPSGNDCYQTVTSTGTYTFTGFNGEDPYGDWYVYIVTNGPASTASSGVLKVYYNYE